MNCKKILRAILVISIVVVCVLSLVRCKPEETPEPDITEINIADTSGTEYVIIFAKDETSYEVWANLLKAKFRATLGIDISSVSDATYEGQNEILVGETARALSATLMDSALQNTQPDSWVWAFGQKDGKLAIYANCKAAYEKALTQLFEDYTKDGVLTVPADLWIIEEYTKAQQDADAAKEEENNKQEEEAKKKKELDDRLIAVKQAIADADFYNSQFGATDEWQSKYAMPTDIYEPDNAITESHPRVLLTSDTLPQIKALLVDDEYSNMSEAFWKLADSKNFTGIFPETYHTNGEKCRYNKTVLAQIEARALAYLITGHKAYGYEAIYGIKNAMLTLLYTTDDHTDVYHGPSHVMFILAEVYDWCYDLLTVQDKKQLISGCVYLLIEANHFTDDDFVLDKNKPSIKASNNEASYGLEYNFPPDNMNAVAGHGTGPQFLRDYMMVSVAFADEMPSWWDYVGGRYYQEYVPVTEKIYQNGFVTQGTAVYGPIKIMVNLVPAYLLLNATGENPIPSYVAQCSEFMLSHLLPNGRMFEIGDGDRTGLGVKSVVHAYFYLFAALYNDTFSLQAAKYFSDNYTSFTTDAIYTMGPALTLALCASCDKASGNFPDDLPLYTYAAYPGGQTIARNSWSSDAAIVLMKVGELTNANHDHLDSGTFQIYYKGLLATSSGYYSKYGQPHHLYYLQSTVASNGLLIYNPNLKTEDNPYYSGSQTNLRTPNNTADINNWLSGMYDIGKVVGVDNSEGKYSYLAGDITKAYSTETVDYVGRRMLTVFNDSTDTPMFFFVYDNVTSDDADYKKSFLLHTVKEPTISGTQTSNQYMITPDVDGKMTATVINDGGKLVLQNLYGGEKMFKIGGEGYAYWIGNENDFDGTAASGMNMTDSYVTSDRSDIVWGRIEITADGTKKTDMLNVMYVTDAGSTVTVPATLIKNDAGTLLGATMNDVTAVFATDNERSSESLTFTTSGDGTMRYFISGLFEGNWTVTINGGTPRNIKVTEASGLLSFTGATGTVTITPGDNIVPSGYARIQYSVGEGTLPTDAAEWYELGKSLTLPVPTHATGYFEGWFTEPEFTNRITEIPETATGTFRVYAKYYTYDVYADLDYSRPTEQMLQIQKDKSNGVEAVAELKLDAENNCLVWTVESGTSKIFKRSSPLLSNLDTDDMAISYTITMSKIPGVPLAQTEYQLRVADSILGTNYGYVTFMCTSAEGGIYLGSSTSKSNMLITTLPDTGEAVTISIVIDFDDGDNGKAVVKAFDGNNKQVVETTISVPTKAQNQGILTMVDWLKWLKTYQIWWVGTGTGAAASIRVHRIYGIEGDHISSVVPVGHAKISYTLNGGTLPDDAPMTYLVGATTPLPTPTNAKSAFRGWYLDTEFTQPITAITAEMTGKVTVYAKWDIIYIYEDYTDGTPNVNVVEKNHNDGQIEYRANGKVGASFITKTGTDGKSYLEWTKGTSDSFICATKTSSNYSTITGDAIVSMTFDLMLIDGKPFICADAKILASSNQGGGEDCIFQIKSNGDICLNNRTDKVIGNIQADKRVTVRIVVDFTNEIYTAYDADGKVIASCAMVLPQKAKDQGYITFDDWRKEKLTQYLCYVQARTSESGAVLGINSIVIEEGNAFAK